jgi:hypothetical protein
MAANARLDGVHRGATHRAPRLDEHERHARRASVREERSIAARAAASGGFESRWCARCVNGVRKASEGVPQPAPASSRARRPAPASCAAAAAARPSSR